MNKPNEFDNTPVAGGYIPPELGGHTCVIKQVNERKNKNGGDMIVVLLDFDANDKQPGYFMEAFQKDVRPEKKYPNDATVYINVNNNDGKCSKGFKTFCACYENSNNTKVSWTAADWCGQFKGKKIGAVYGEVEELYNGQVKHKSKHRWFCDYSKAKDAKIPNPQLLSDAELAKNGLRAEPAQNAEFVNVPDGTSDELPFA